jgi:hypothetical protein
MKKEAQNMLSFSGIFYNTSSRCHCFTQYHSKPKTANVRSC